MARRRRAETEAQAMTLHEVSRRCGSLLAMPLPFPARVTIYPFGGKWRRTRLISESAGDEKMDCLQARQGDTVRKRVKFAKPP